MKQKKKKNQKSQKNNLSNIVLLMSLLLIILIIVNINVQKNKPVYSQKIDVSFNISDRFGLVLNDTNLDFGTLRPDSAIEKKIIITNEFNYPVRVDVIIDPNLREYVFGTTNIVLQPGEEYVYSVVLKIPKEIEMGKYTGFLELRFFPEK